MFSRSILSAAIVSFAAAASLPAQASVSIDSPAFTYSQSFDSLTTSTNSVAWANDSTLAGWSLFTATGSAITSYLGGTGSVNTGSFYSFGSTGSSDRALGGTASGGTYFGSPASGAVAGYIAVAFTNNSGSVLDSFTLAFDGEQWRNGGNSSAQAMVLQYGFGSSFGSVASWATPGGNFDWSSPVTGATAAAVNGNTAGLVAGKGGTVATSWASGDTLWVRWIDNNDVGNDHGLAIDNLSLSVTTAPVPEPTSTALLLAGLAAVAFIARRRA
jgi:hypothetical protein